MAIGKLSMEWAKRAGLPYWYEQECTSTNEIAKDLALMEKENIRLFFTDHQTHGKGRGTHSWSDDQGEQLLSTWSFQTGKSPQPTLSPLIGLAVFKALTSSFLGLPFFLKAPNDIYLRDRKLAGILLENVQIGQKNRLLVGLGLNVFSCPLPEISTCLADALLSPIEAQNWAQFLDRLLLEVTIAISGNSDSLSAIDQQHLLYALNLNPALTHKYLEISPRGDLKTSEKTTLWSEL